MSLQEKLFKQVTKCNAELLHLSVCYIHTLAKQVNTTLLKPISVR